MPLAVVQILTGILLGPSLLGRLAPDSCCRSSPGRLAPLASIANLAVTLFALVTGLHVDPKGLRGMGGTLLQVGIGSALLPAAPGCGCRPGPGPDAARRHGGRRVRA